MPESTYSLDGNKEPPARTNKRRAAEVQQQHSNHSSCERGDTRVPHLTSARCPRRACGASRPTRECPLRRVAPCVCTSEVRLPRAVPRYKFVSPHGGCFAYLRGFQRDTQDVPVSFFLLLLLFATPELSDSSFADSALCGSRVSELRSAAGCFFFSNDDEHTNRAKGLLRDIDKGAPGRFLSFISLLLLLSLLGT